MALGGLLALAPQTPAAEKAGGTKAEAKGGGRQDRLNRIAEELKLTDEQKEKLKPVFREETKKLQELRKDTTLSRPERREKQKAIREDLRAKVKPILTPEQLEQWDKLQAQGQTRRRTQ